MPIVSGRGKQCRLLSTVGVARGLGDHDLLAKGSGIRCKEFLSPQPEVQIFDILDEEEEEEEEGGEVDCLVLGSDGLWDVLSNEDVRRIVRRITKNEEVRDGLRLVSL